MQILASLAKYSLLEKNLLYNKWAIGSLLTKAWYHEGSYLLIKLLAQMTEQVPVPAKSYFMSNIYTQRTCPFF